MPKFPTLWIVVLAILGQSFSCSSRNGADDASTATSASDASHGLPVLGQVSDFRLIDQSGEPFGSDDLRGKAYIATFIFTRSQTTTPEQMRWLTDLQDQFRTLPEWASVRLVSISAEPEADTPSVLADFADQAGADSSHWKFLTGDRSEIWELCSNGFGLQARDDARTQQRPITFSPAMVLVDRAGRIRGRFETISSESQTTLLNDLASILFEAPDLAAVGAPQDKAVAGHDNLVVPEENLRLTWLDSRRRAQLAAGESYDVFHDFSLQDRRQESGIEFRDRIVNNAGKDWMPNHYDHGNGVAAADVDGDGDIDLYFTTQVGANQLWRNNGDGTFENWTDRAGPIALDEQTSVTASFADVDNDGDPDLFVTSVKGGNHLFANQGDGTFVDVTEQAGVGYRGHSSAAVFFDYNRDGLLDLFVVNVGIYTTDEMLPVTNGTSPEQTGGRYRFYKGLDDAFIAHMYPDRAEASIMYKNLGGGRFADVTEAVGLVDLGWSGDAAPLDANNDGWTDLYVLNMQGNDSYFENVDGQRFVDKTQEMFPHTPWGAMGIQVFDFDNDGQRDIFITDMHSDMSENIGPEREKLKSRMQWPDSLLQTGGQSIYGNAFFRNDGGVFREISDEIGAENYWPWGLSTGDLNADGYEDVFIASSMNYPFRYGVNSVLLNEHGERFVDSEYVLGVEPRRDGNRLTPWYDLACGGEDKDHEYCLGRTGDATVWAPLGSRSSVVFDLDGDGDLDIVTNDFNSEPLVLVSDLSERKDGFHYLGVRVVGTTSNRDGLGASVTVHAGDDTYTKTMDGVTGYLSHGLVPLYFGLGDAEVVDEIDVRWPSGESQRIAGPVPAGSTIDVTESTD